MNEFGFLFLTKVFTKALVLKRFLPWEEYISNLQMHFSFFFLVKMFSILRKQHIGMLEIQPVKKTTIMRKVHNFYCKISKLFCCVKSKLGIALYMIYRISLIYMYRGGGPGDNSVCLACGRLGFESHIYVGTSTL